MRTSNRRIFTSHALATAACAVSALAAAGCGSGGTTVPGPPASTARTATITNTGSTNTLPYTVVVVVNADGTVSPSALPPALATQLFADLAAASPVSALPTEFCAKSASFGSSTYVSYAGSTSPDLQCQGNSTQGTALNQDVTAIVQTLNLGGARNPATVP